MTEKDDQPKDSRARKVEGREKRRRFRQGTRSYLHAMTNSIARRAGKKRPPA
jgi:hypothetical protein